MVKLGPTSAKLVQTGPSSARIRRTPANLAQIGPSLAVVSSSSADYGLVRTKVATNGSKAGPNSPNSTQLSPSSAECGSHRHMANVEQDMANICQGLPCLVNIGPHWPRSAESRGRTAACEQRTRAVLDRNDHANGTTTLPTKKTVAMMCACRQHGLMLGSPREGVGGTAQGSRRRPKGRHGAGRAAQAAGGAQGVGGAAKEVGGAAQGTGRALQVVAGTAHVVEPPKGSP